LAKYHIEGRYFIYLKSLHTFNLNFKIVKNLKLLFVFAPVAGLFFITIAGCSKSNNSSTPAATDSVFYSPWITLSAAYNSTDSAYEQTLPAASITQNVLDHGAVLSYIKDAEGDVVPPDDLGLTPFYDLQSIFLIAGGDFSTTSYRYIVIPGTIAVTSSAANRAVSGTAATIGVAGLKAMSYAQVIKALNIPAEGGSK
jgi:hypothetical protein